MTRVAIIAALPDELKPLVRGWAREARGGVTVWRWPHREGEWIAACAGTGPPAAARAFAETERQGPVDSVISVGWAGAAQNRFAAGQAYRVSEVIDARNGEHFPTPTLLDECRLVTNPQVADRAEKQRLAATFAAGLVDMEAAAVARLAGIRGIPFYCVKGVSDSLTDRLPDFNRFIAADGRFQMARFVLFAVPRPWYWRVLMRMGQNSAAASRRVSEAVLEILDEEKNLRKPQGG